MALPPLSNVGKSSQVNVFTVPAGGNVPVKATGTYLYVITAPPGIKLRLGGQPFVDSASGTSLETVGQAYFEWYEVFNPLATDVTVKVYSGFARYRENAFAVLEAPTESVGWTGDTILANAGVTFTAAITGLRVQRKAIVISNRDASAELQLRDSFGNVLGIIFAQTAQIYHVSDDVEVYNDTGTAISAHVGEIYWLRPAT